MKMFKGRHEHERDEHNRASDELLQACDKAYDAARPTVASRATALEATARAAGIYRHGPAARRGACPIPRSRWPIRSS
jgi:hypothetical protein